MGIKRRIREKWLVVAMVNIEERHGQQPTTPLIEKWKQNAMTEPALNRLCPLAE
ncbi:hypothetical protein Cflav_PD1116 [Pedosphaera parvula Ellin514]|uniref:Uncharacterized protein n=1 Tax=Pedosphaera parvula (strain Ellin514) TaxID=320771 RepID=B9XQB7_PEDPL|nr:hypothetical protein Cflav_PD1116 [Pedosphaera parvula Ellin514]